MGAYGCAITIPLFRHCCRSCESPDRGLESMSGWYTRQFRVVSSWIEGMVHVKRGSGW